MTRSRQTDPYIVLGVDRQASAEEISRAYRRAARATHPDGGGAGSTERFRAVSNAYDELRDAGRRAIYDRSHPVVRSHTFGRSEPSVDYAAPGSQHVVLGRSVPHVNAGSVAWFAGIEEWPVRWGEDIERGLRVAVSLLRRGW